MKRLLLVVACACICASAFAQGFPNKSLRIIVPTGPGSISDTFMRLLAANLTPLLGQPVVVENKVGANGIIGADTVAKAPADGHTILAGNFSTHAANPALYLKLPYDPVRDFAPIARIGAIPYLLVTAPNFPAANFAELVRLAQSKPGKLTYASGSSPSIVAMESIKRAANMDVLHVPYKTVVQAIPDVSTGQVDMMVADIGTASPQIKAGKLKALANVASRRTALLPELPAIAELGITGLDVVGFVGMYVAAGAPKEALDKLESAMRTALAQAGLKERMASLGVEVIMTSQSELATFTGDQLALWGRLIKEAGIKPE
jgi:tripartite-type tricarboxylate transporter receptor subunit TctC